MEATNETTTDNKKHVTVEDVNVEILPFIYEIIRGLVSFFVNRSVM